MTTDNRSLGDVPMLVTLTPNPSLDRTLEVAELRRGAVLRATGQRIDPGGKGVNVARAWAADGLEAVAVLPVGGPDGAQLMDRIAAEGVHTVGVGMHGAVRTNITVAEPDGTVTKLNEAGPELDAEELERLIATTVDVARDRGATWVAGCGSLPAGAPDDLYAQLVRRAHKHGLKAAVDTSGTPLAAVIDTSPDLIKPNAEELAELAGRPLPGVKEVVAAAAGLCERGVSAVLVSLGADGALLVTGEGVVHAVPPTVEVASTVGAGDATLAGYLAASGRPAPKALVEAVAWGTAAVCLPGTRMPGPEDVAVTRARVRIVDRPRAPGTAGQPTVAAGAGGPVD